ncbi:MAG: hypothetical protein Q8L52_00485 [bacterium]|nr:hypothetical protein [bacterium]
MIVDIHHGDITDLRNKRDIIIGMNVKLAEASAIGRRVLVDKIITRDMQLGDVITFKFDAERDLHMIICHRLGVGGWACHADAYIRFGLDFLWQHSKGNNEFSIVKIGCGLVGRRDGADSTAIHTAMTNSFARLHLFVWDKPKRTETNVVNLPPLQPLRTWSSGRGEREIRIAA